MSDGGGTHVVEKLKLGVLASLHLMAPNDLKAYWAQAKWPKPNPANLANSQIVETAGSKSFAPLRYALGKLPPEILAEASKQLDPFGWLLEATNVSEWSKFCQMQKATWMTRVWIAAASQLHAERRLIFKSHGWSDTWEELRRNPQELRAAENFFAAQLGHAEGQRRTELLGIRLKGLSEAARRRLRRAKKSAGGRAGVSLAEKFIVQHWLELPHGMPGLCFFSDSALHDLLDAFGLNTGEGEATKQIRVRLGLIQAGAKSHLVEEVVNLNNKLLITGRNLKEPWVIKGKLLWGRQRLWPR